MSGQRSKGLTPQKARKAKFKKIRKVSFDADAGEPYGVTILRRAATRRGKKEDSVWMGKEGKEEKATCVVV